VIPARSRAWTRAVRVYVEGIVPDSEREVEEGKYEVRTLHNRKSWMWKT
jgi:hypothetical protein